MRARGEREKHATFTYVTGVTGTYQLIEPNDEEAPNVLVAILSFVRPNVSVTSPASKPNIVFADYRNITFDTRMIDCNIASQDPSAHHLSQKKCVLNPRPTLRRAKPLQLEPDHTTQKREASDSSAFHL